MISVPLPTTVLIAPAPTRADDRERLERVHGSAQATGAPAATQTPSGGWASTTDVWIWRSGIVQYLSSSAVVSSGEASSKP